MFENPIDEHAVQEGRDLRLALPYLAPRQRLTCCYMHWAVEAYGEDDKAYNVTISLHDGQWKAVIDTDPRLNATRPPQEGYAAHTYLRNSYALGVSVEAMLGATASDFGQYPVQEHQLEVLCSAVAAVCLKYGIDISPDSVMTHAEAAIKDGYFGERWDLARLAPSSDPLSPADAVSTGDLLRKRIQQYRLALIQS